VEIVDSPEVEPTEGTQEPAPTDSQTQENYLGDYRTREDAEQALREAKAKMHEATQEAARYREERDTFRSAIPGQQAPPQNTEEMNEKFRVAADQDLFGTFYSVAQQAARAEADARNKEQQATYQRFREYSEQEGYRDVAESVAKTLPFAQPADPVEASFLREKVRILEGRLKAGAGADTNQTALNQRRAFVEPGTGSGASDVMRVEVDKDARRVLNMFNLSDAEKKELVLRTARNRESGLSDKRERVITDYTGAR
jgi:hypothetical protein